MWQKLFVCVCVSPHPPVPHADSHVVLVTHRDDEVAVGGERHAGHAVLMGLNLGHLASIHLPHPHAGHVATLTNTHTHIQVRI